jgi:hypothetical protein
LWVRKKKAEEEKSQTQSDEESFREHDEIMEKFRTAHPNREVKIVAPRDLIKTNGNLLAPVDATTVGKNRQN